MSVVNVEQYFSYMHDNNVGTIPMGGPVDGDEVCHRIIRQNGQTDNSIGWACRRRRSLSQDNTTKRSDRQFSFQRAKRGSPRPLLTHHGSTFNNHGSGLKIQSYNFPY
jgi:hypothetical protein